MTPRVTSGCITSAAMTGASPDRPLNIWDRLIGTTASIGGQRNANSTACLNSRSTSMGSYQPSLTAADPALSPSESEWLASRTRWIEQEGDYAHIQAIKPQTLAHALTDSPMRAFPRKSSPRPVSGSSVYSTSYGGRRCRSAATSQRWSSRGLWQSTSMGHLRACARGLELRS